MADSPADGSGAASTRAPYPPEPPPKGARTGYDPWWAQRLLADIIIYLDRIRRFVEHIFGMPSVPAPGCIGVEVMNIAALSDKEMNIWKPIRVKPYKADNAMDGAGNYGTVVAFLQQPRALVEETLPPQLTLFSPAAKAAATHPVVLTFGQQNAVRAYSNPLNMGLQYLESVTIVPHVYLRREAVFRQFGATIAQSSGTYFGPFNYMPRLYLDQLLPTLVGWALAYAKRWSRIKYTGNSLQASSLITGSPHYRAQFERGALLPQVAEQHPALEPWLKMLNAPMVSRTPTGKLLFTKFYWPWKYAAVWDVNLQLNVTDSGVRALPAGQYSFDTVSGLKSAHDSRNFAFITALGWRLLLPFARELLNSGDGESF